MKKSNNKFNIPITDDFYFYYPDEIFHEMHYNTQIYGRYREGFKRFGIFIKLTYG